MIFDEEGSYIQNKASGEINWLREDNGNYVLDVTIVPGHAWQGSDAAGFHGQP